jgi:hypothetical protein
VGAHDRAQLGLGERLRVGAARRGRRERDERLTLALDPPLERGRGELRLFAHRRVELLAALLPQELKANEAGGRDRDREAQRQREKASSNAQTVLS